MDIGAALQLTGVGELFKAAKQAEKEKCEPRIIRKLWNKYHEACDAAWDERVEKGYPSNVWECDW